MAPPRAQSRGRCRVPHHAADFRSRGVRSRAAAAQEHGVAAPRGRRRARGRPARRVPGQRGRRRPDARHAHRHAAPLRRRTGGGHGRHRRPLARALEPRRGVAGHLRPRIVSDAEALSRRAAAPGADGLPGAANGRYFPNGPRDHMPIPAVPAHPRTVGTLWPSSGALATEMGDDPDGTDATVAGCLALARSLGAIVDRLGPSSRSA